VVGNSYGFWQRQLAVLLQVAPRCTAEATFEHGDECAAVLITEFERDTGYAVAIRQHFQPAHQATLLAPVTKRHRGLRLESPIEGALAGAEQEIAALLKGLDGVFVDPGPSGARTRGRLDTLPTGRN
jgi:cobalamin biosynthesis Mg chelatase CobN